MKRIKTFALLTCGILLYCGSLVASEPKLQRLGSSPEQPQVNAVLVEGGSLLHTAQILPRIDADGFRGTSIQTQTQAVLKRLSLILEVQNASQENIVKLNLYLKDEADRERVSQQIAEWCGKETLPAISFVQSALPDPEQKIALDAVVAVSATDEVSHHTLNRRKQSRVSDFSLLPAGDVVYVSGQAEAGELKEATRLTLESLVRTLGHLELGREQIVSLKCFLTPMSRVAEVQREIATFFGDAAIPVVSYVEWQAGETRPIEIELIASAPLSDNESSVSYFTPPDMKSSPVYSRVARIHGTQRIYIAGLYSDREGTGEEQTKLIFAEMIGILRATNSDYRHLAKATYYVSSTDASSQLNLIRPSIYDPERPPAASKALVSGVGMSKRQLSIDMIAAPIKAEK